MVLHHTHLHRLFKDAKGDWQPTRIAYVAKGNGEIIIANVRVTSITNHGQNIQVRFLDSDQPRTLHSTLILAVTSPQDVSFQNAHRIVVN